ncbi:MAG: ATP-binding protein [Patescibacteria group bacterium]
MEINLELLTIQNPWWQGTSLKFDPVIDAYDHQSINVRPKIIDDFNLNQDTIYTLHSARGLGKSTAIKILIKELIEKKGIDPNNIFYYSCHNIDTYEQLNELIKVFLTWHQEGEKRRYIFIDEITLIKNWQKGINYLREAGRLKNITLVLAGSNLAIKKPLSKAENKFIVSLNFIDFINLINPVLFKEINQKNYFKHAGQLDYYLDIYFLTGGFISTLNSYRDKGAIGQGIYSNYLYWLISDFAKMGRDISLLRQILEQVLLKLGQPIGYKTIAHRTKAKTHLTVAEYLNILESSFSVKLVYQSDAKGNISKNKAKKVYFRDPFLFWLFYSYIHGAINYWEFSRDRLHREDIFSALVENVIFGHLIKDETLDNWGKKVSYWRDNVKKNEINFLVNNGDKITPILIRHNKEIADRDKAIFKKAGFSKGIIISKDEMKLDKNIKIIPLVYFLLFYKNYVG